jgi:hypothetical protein
VVCSSDDRGQSAVKGPHDRPRGAQHRTPSCPCPGSADMLGSKSAEESAPLAQRSRPLAREVRDGVEVGQDHRPLRGLVLHQLRPPA